MRNRRNVQLVLLVAGLVTLAERRCHAYGGSPHHSIVSLSWEVMRAAADAQFGNNVNWSPVPPATVGVPPVPLTDFGACALCGTGANPADWNTFLGRIAPALIRLNSLDAGLSSLPCSGTISADNKTLGQMLWAVGTDPTLGDSVSDCTKKFIATKLQGGAYDFAWHAGGIFDFTHPNPNIDTSRFQGLMLGWHAKTGDDHLNDTVFESFWLNFGVTGLVIAALVAVGLVILLGGGLFLAAAIAVAIVAVIVLTILFCLVGIFDGNGCGNGVVDGFTHLIEAAHSPVTELDRRFPEIDAIIPRGGDVKSSDYTGMWHFVDARSGGSNSYDDRQGLNYDEAGPHFESGQLDIVVQAGLDLGDLHLGYDESDGPHRYEIVGINDGHQNTDRRGFAKWQGPTGAHIPFEPLDNFASYGWTNFLAAPDAHWLSWPLHALGDATVPMHVTGTTGWGHRPYEATLDWVWKWNVIRFLPCVPEAGNCPQQCSTDANNPKCNERADQVTATSIGAENYREQWEQARRVLQHAFRWSQFINSWRSRTGKMKDVPVRDMVTQLALETLSASNENAGDNVWPWCDNCSMQYAMPIIQTEGGGNLGKDFYTTDQNLAKSRDLVERAVGATAAFLIATADVLPPPACSMTTCQAGLTCCGGRTCQNGACCAPTAGACQHDTDCCGGPASSVCRNGFCAPKVIAPCQRPGQSCEDGAAVCCVDSANGKQCGQSMNGVNICCFAAGTSCTSSVQCCDGLCDITVGNIGVCRKLPTGSGCTASSQCQAPSICQSHGLPPIPLLTQGTCCNPSATGTLDCTTDSDCCTGACLETANDEFKCQCAGPGVRCAGNNDCCAGNTCVNGACQASCHPNQTACQDNSQCCGGSVCCAIVTGGPVCKTACTCSPHGGLCATDTDCCIGNSCQGGHCLETCGHASAVCSSSSQCCSGHCDEGGACQCEAPGTACLETADCCSGTLCCAGPNGGAGTCKSSCCQPPGQTCQVDGDCCGGTICCANTGFTCATVNDCTVQ